MLTNPQALAFAVAGPVIKQQGQAPVYQTLLTSYDLNDVSGFRAANRQASNSPTPIGAFPTSFAAVNTETANSNQKGTWMCNTQGSPSTWNGGGLAKPWSGRVLYTEGSGINDNGVAEAYRFVLKLPGQWRRENGVTISAEILADVPPALNPKATVWYRGTGEPEGQLTKGTGELTGASSTVRTATFTAPPGGNVVLYLVVESDFLSTFPDKAFFDIGVDNIKVTETFV